MSEKMDFTESKSSEIKMSQKKKRVDRLFFIFALISFVLVFIMPAIAKEIIAGIIIGFIGTSLVFELGIRRVESDNYSQVNLNLIKNIVIYALMMFIAITISDRTFLMCVLTIVTYRLVLLNALRR